ncbi:MAG: dihydrofolate reductase family protein [Planctomycetota bacterium]|nr:dihydrofolate reductase family protein [Planctomycetota bacterium]
MRRIRYQVAMSLDGYIAGPNGEHDWIPTDPDIEFAAFFAQFDTVLVGRRTFEPMVESGNASMFADMKMFVFSKTLSKADHPGITIISDNWEQTVASLRDESGKDIWLFGGGQLFQSLLGAKLIDTVEIAVVPVLLGGGIQMAPPPISTEKLELTNHKVYGKSGIVLLEYVLMRP